MIVSSLGSVRVARTELQLVVELAKFATSSRRGIFRKRNGDERSQTNSASAVMAITV